MPRLNCPPHSAASTDTPSPAQLLLRPGPLVPTSLSLHLTLPGRAHVAHGVLLHPELTLPLPVLSPHVGPRPSAWRSRPRVLWSLLSRHANLSSCLAPSTRHTANTASKDPRDSSRRVFIFVTYFYLSLAARGPHCCVRAFSGCGEARPLLAAAPGLLTVAASLAAEHGLTSCGARA